MRMQDANLQSWSFTQAVEHLKYDQLPPGYPTHLHTGSPILFPCPRTRCVSAGVLHLLTVLPATPWSIGPISATRPEQVLDQPAEIKYWLTPLWTKTFGASTPSVGHFHRHSLAWTPWARQRNLHLSVLKLSMSFSLFMKLRGQFFTMNYGTGKYGQLERKDRSTFELVACVTIPL